MRVARREHTARHARGLLGSNTTPLPELPKKAMTHDSNVSWQQEPAPNAPS